MTLTKIIATSKNQLLILMVLAIALNTNTVFNDFAMDDVVVLTENSLVQKGIKGIPELLHTEYFYGALNRNSELSAGRYRPFALIVMAFEFQFFGMHAWVYHLINILLFALLIALLFRLLKKYVFRNQHPYLAFVTCLLFVAHPIHTEVIANIKSGDELITFILLLLCSFSLIRYSKKKSILILFSGLLCFFLALLTRESAVPFITVVPLVAYFFFGQPIKKALIIAIPLLTIFIIYFVLRISIVGISVQSHLQILDAPFLYASPSQAFATKVFILLKYVCLLFFPHPLSCDYSYNQIPYISIASFPFMISAFVLLVILIYAFLSFNKKSLFAFCILFFLITIFLFTNFIVDIGAPLAERLLFQPSIAFCVALAYIFIIIMIRHKFISIICLLFIIVLFSVKTIARNGEWKNNETLYLSAVKASPNSIRTNDAAADIYLSKASVEKNKILKKEYFTKTIYYAEQSLKWYPENHKMVDYLTAAYDGLLDYYSTLDLFFEENKINQGSKEVKNIINKLSIDYYKQGNGFYEQNMYDAAIKSYLRCLKFNKNNVEAWYNLGGNYFLKKDSIAATKAWETVKKLDPKHKLNTTEFSNE